MTAPSLPTTVPSLPTAARVLAAFALALGIVLPFVSLPPFALGYWEKAEPLVVGLHGVAALAAFALAVAACRVPAVVMECFRHPYVLLPLALALWSSAMAPFTDLPLLSLIGAPQSGFGALWQADFAVLIAAARLLRGDRVVWPALGRLAVAAVAAVAAVKAFDWAWERTGGTHLLVWVASYYGWLGLALPVVMPALGNGRWRRLGPLAAAVTVILASRSMGLVAGAVIGGVMAVVLGRVKDARGRWIGLSMAALAAVAPGFLLVFLPQVGAVTSAADRRALLHMLWNEMSGWPWFRWISGMGWGRTQDVFHANLQASGMTLWNESWIFMASDYFHSHNALAEALLAAGVPALALTLAWPLVLPLACDPARRAAAAGFAVGYALMSAIWFPLALCVPMLALATAALAPVPQPRLRRVPWARPVLVGGLGVAGLGGVLLAGILVHHGRAVEAARADIFAGAAAPRLIPADPRGGDLMAAELIRDGFRHVETLAQSDRARYVPASLMMAEYLRRRIPETRTTLLPVSGLSLMAQVRVIQSLGWLENEAALPGRLWAEWLGYAWRLAPGRSDLAIPLFGHLAVRGRFDLLEPGVRELLRRDRRDPVGLYFLGLLTVQRPEQAAKRAGLDMLRASIDSGIGRYMPLDPALWSLLER